MRLARRLALRRKTRSLSVKGWPYVGPPKSPRCRKSLAETRVQTTSPNWTPRPFKRSLTAVRPASSSHEGDTHADAPLPGGRDADVQRRVRRRRRSGSTSRTRPGSRPCRRVDRLGRSSARRASPRRSSTRASRAATPSCATAARIHGASPWSSTTVAAASTTGTLMSDRDRLIAADDFHRQGGTLTCSSTSQRRRSSRRGCPSSSSAASSCD